MPYILNEKIKIGISACCFAARVRYNWKGWDKIAPLEREKDDFTWMPVCPEVMSGLNKRLGKPPGTFGSLLLKENLFLIPAQDLESPIKWWDWRRRLHAFAWLKRKEIKNKKELYEIWHNFKFLCREINRKEADEKIEIPVDKISKTNFAKALRKLENKA